MRSLLRVVAACVLLSPVSSFAQRLPATVTPEHYDLAFVVDLERNRFEGTETIRIQVPQPTRRIVLHAADITFREVTVGAGAAAQKADVAVDAAAQTATMTFAKPLAEGASEVHIRYDGVLNDQLRGFYISKGKNRKYAVTQFEATDARRAFPCFDEPVYKATFAVTLTIDRGDTAISNGKVLSDTPGPSPSQHTLTFATTPRMSTYLVAMVVGDFQCLEGSAENVPIRICATPDKKELGRVALDSAQDILKFFNTYYSIKYPFGKLDVVAVPDFAAGAMENTAAIFYRETLLLADAKEASIDTRKEIASVLAHEIAHQWFGNLVTMDWWDDIWLNEGFATWMANKPLAALHPEWNIAVDEANENQTALTLDSLRSTRPIHSEVRTPAQIDEAFDAIAYQKGAAVIRMVENYLGAEAFRGAVNAYLQTYAYKNATSEHFWQAIAKSSGKPIDRILPTFVNQPGAPLIDVSMSCAAGKTTVTLKQQQFTLASGPAAAAPGAKAGAQSGRWQIPICLKSDATSTSTCEVLADPVKTITLPGGTCASWVFANAGARGYYRTAYTPEMLRALVPRLDSGLTAAERFSLVDDEWALVRAGRHTAADYLTLVAGFGREHTSGVLSQIAGRLGTIRSYLTTTETAPRLEAFTRSLLRPLYAELGLGVTPSEGDDRKALRDVVVRTLGANDADVAAQARSLLDRSLAGGAPLDPTLADAIVAVAAGHGDAKLFDTLAAAADRTTDPEEHYRYLYALGAFSDPALVDRGLQRALSPDLRSQDTSQYLARFLGNGAARERAWTFVKAQWPALEPKVSIFGGDTTLVSALGGFCDARSRDDIVSFFKTHPLPGAARTLEQTVERINGCIALREKQTAVVSDWLRAR